ncbi:MAG: RNA polymerase sigma factor [Pseudomonadota bacterium]
MKPFVDEREKLIATAVRIVNDRAIAEDLVQESWLRWASKNYQASQARLILLRIVKNLAIDWRRRRRVEFEALETHRLFQDSPYDAERIVGARQLLERVVQVIETLPPRTRLAFRYSRVEGLTLKETGRRLGVSESRASQLVSDAIIRIVAVLDT